MRLTKLFVMAVLVGAVAVIGCSDDGGTAGSGGTAGMGGGGMGGDGGMGGGGMGGDGGCDVGPAIRVWYSVSAKTPHAHERKRAYA
jgi:hypothetical protein